MCTAGDTSTLGLDKFVNLTANESHQGLFGERMIHGLAYSSGSTAYFERVAHPETDSEAE